MAVTHMIGLGKVIANLNRHVAKIPNVTVAGLHEAAVLIKGEAQDITPHDTGNLKGGAYVDPVKKSGGGVSLVTELSVVVGYNADYALYVHEIDANYKVGQWKFLETAVKQNSRQVFKILRAHARIR